MNIKHRNQELEIADDSFAWRYMKFNRLIDILSNHNLYFTRLDQFEDLMEGLEFTIWRDLHLLRFYEQPNSRNKPKVKLPTKQQISKWQLGAFASCWFLTEQKELREDKHHDSLAMWELYGKDGFAIGIKFSVLKELIETVLSSFEDREIRRACFGKVLYQSFFNDFEQSPSSKYRALLKQSNFEHEREVRFILERDKLKLNENRIGINLTIEVPADTTNKVVRILSHPGLNWAKFETFSKKLSALNFNLSPSMILTKQNTFHLIEDN